MGAHPPLALDIDGTMTRPDDTIDPRLFDILTSWDGPIILATGKAFPYPVALCHFIGIPKRVVAENGGVLCIDETVELVSSTEQIEAFRHELAQAGIDIGWGVNDLVNRWRETELAIDRSVSRSRLESMASDHALEVIDSGYAYHIKDPTVSKGSGIARAGQLLGFELTEVVAIGDSENDVSTFERVGTSIALENADATAKAAADRICDGSYSQGTISVLMRYLNGSSE